MNTPEFVSFHRLNTEHWGAVSFVLSKLEAFLIQYSVNLAYIDGHQLVKLATDDLPRLTRSDLLSCILNNDEVATVVFTPGQQFKGKNARELAAVLIQSVVRRFLVQRKFHGKSVNELAARKIQNRWHVFHPSRSLRHTLRDLRREQTTKWKELTLAFQLNWNTVCRSDNDIFLNIGGGKVEQRQ